LLGAVFIALFIFGHSFGIGSQGLTLAALSFPTSMRGAASGFAQAVTRVGSIMGFYFFPLLIAAVGLYATLLTLTVVPIIALAAVIAIKWDPPLRDVDQEHEANTPGEPAPQELHQAASDRGVSGA
jgi:MFS transporter, putative metabolite transport protein